MSRGRGGNSGDVCHDFNQFFQRHGLYKVSAEAGLAEAGFDFGSVVAGQGDGLHRMKGEHLGQEIAPVAVVFIQTDVADQQVGPSSACGVEGGEIVVRFAHAVAAVGEKARKQSGRVGVIIDQKDIHGEARDVNESHPIKFRRGPGK